MDTLKVARVNDDVSSTGFDDEEIKDGWCDPDDPKVIK